MRSKTIIAVICLLLGIAFTRSTAAQSNFRQAGPAYIKVAVEGNGRLTTEDRKPAGTPLENWSIHSSAFLGLREGGRSFSLDSRGGLEKRSKNHETKTTVHAADLQEIAKLIQELNLPRAKTRSVRGKKIYDFPYWNFTISLNGKSFLMEGFSFYDAKFVVMTKNRRKAFSKLKDKLIQVGAER